MKYIREIIITWILGSNPEKVIRHLIRKYLVGYHLASNPVRKSKRSDGAALI